jgi:hypothetical protein
LLPGKGPAGADSVTGYQQKSANTDENGSTPFSGAPGAVAVLPGTPLSVRMAGVMTMVTTVVCRRGKRGGRDQQHQGEHQKLFHTGYPDTGIPLVLCGKDEKKNRNP